MVARLKKVYGHFHFLSQSVRCLAVISVRDNTDWHPALLPHFHQYQWIWEAAAAVWFKNEQMMQIWTKRAAQAALKHNSIYFCLTICHFVKQLPSTAQKPDLLAMPEVPYVGEVGGGVFLLSDVQSSNKWVKVGPDKWAAGRDGQRGHLDWLHTWPFLLHSQAVSSVRLSLCLGKRKLSGCWSEQTDFFYCSGFSYTKQ